MNNLFASAASLLLGEPGQASVIHDVHLLLTELGYAPPGGAGLSWHRATRLSDRGEVWLPADLCLRRPPALQEFAPPFPLSTGSAAGTSWEGAALHGLLELIERDAASLWWHGGRPGRAVPSDVDASTQALLAELRSGAAAARRSWLLDITTDTGIPAVTALS